MERIIDANLNRAREGLRVLEEVGRFILNKQILAEQLKQLRHELSVWDQYTTLRLLSARSAGEDVGAFLDPPTEKTRENLVDLVLANSKRVQESLRVLEEYGKLESILAGGDLSGKAKKIRFSVYEIEKALVGAISRKRDVDKIMGLYVIIDMDFAKGRDEVELARKAIDGGASVIQLRAKNRDKGLILGLARNLQEVCSQNEVLFIVNDHIDLCLAANADGVHLGQKDLPVVFARNLLPIDKIVGCSTANLPEALRAEADGADYIGVGAMFPTSTKLDTRPAGPTTLRAIKKEIGLPVVAIGGINAGNLDEIIEAGADAAAVVSAVIGVDDVEGAARELSGRLSQR